MLLDRRRYAPVSGAWNDWTAYRGGRWRVTVIQRRTRLVVWYRLYEGDKAARMLWNALGR